MGLKELKKCKKSKYLYFFKGNLQRGIVYEIINEDEVYLVWKQRDGTQMGKVVCIKSDYIEMISQGRQPNSNGYMCYLIFFLFSIITTLLIILLSLKLEQSNNYQQSNCYFFCLNTELELILVKIFG